MNRGSARGKTSDIERLNNTLRQRIAQLVRKSLSFSKKIENHIGAIWYFIQDYNRHIREAIEENRNRRISLHSLHNATTPILSLSEFKGNTILLYENGEISYPDSVSSY